MVWDHLYRGWRDLADGGDPDLRAYLRGEWRAGEALLREWLRDGEGSEAPRRAGWGDRCRGLLARRGGGDEPVGEAADGGCCA